MRIINLDFQDVTRFKLQIDEIVEFLRTGKIIVYPTDTIYGIGCDALNPKAVEKVIRIKGVQRKKPLSIMVRDIEGVKKYAELSEKNEVRLESFLPGPFTFVLPRTMALPGIVTNNERTIGVRIPSNLLTQALLKNFENPIITTSVNSTGEDPLNDPFKIVDFFQRRSLYPDIILDGGRIKDATPSIVIDLSGRMPKILRANIMSSQEMLNILTKLS